MQALFATVQQPALQIIYQLNEPRPIVYVKYFVKNNMYKKPIVKEMQALCIIWHVDCFVYVQVCIVEVSDILEVEHVALEAISVCHQQVVLP